MKCAMAYNIHRYNLYFYSYNLVDMNETFI